MGKGGTGPAPASSLPVLAESHVLGRDGGGRGGQSGKAKSILQKGLFLTPPGGDAAGPRLGRWRWGGSGAVALRLRGRDLSLGAQERSPCIAAGCASRARHGGIATGKKKASSPRGPKYRSWPGCAGLARGEGMRPKVVGSSGVRRACLLLGMATASPKNRGEKAFCQLQGEE